jgi:5-hydroxyisourate hydrolase-like protein (transthyretin family)/peptidoglycan/xylan/chitin deacetylase (PgdA/CDA1 family)
MGRLSTHVLDTVNGRPAAGVRVVLHRVGSEAREVVVETRTNADGRTDAPLMAAEAMRAGTYEMLFHVGDYFRAAGTATADPPFLDVVPVRFTAPMRRGTITSRSSSRLGATRPIAAAEMTEPYPRDLVGYGRNPPHPQWPDGARICVQFVINYEEGGENNILHGDRASEAFLSEIVGAQAWLGQRHMSMESIYEYGSRAGFWRLWRMFTERRMPVTVYGVATALMRNPEAVAAMKEAGWEIASHGLKWIDYRDFSSDEERAHLKEAIRLHTEATGQRPLGWYTGRTSEHTNRLVAEEGGFLYSADSYADELPYWIPGPQGPHLVCPIRSTPTTCALPRLKGSMRATSSSPI